MVDASCFRFCWDWDLVCDVKGIQNVWTLEDGGDALIPETSDDIRVDVESNG